MMGVFIASDHAGVGAKKILLQHLQKWGHKPIDLGPGTEERIDYPLKAQELISQMTVDPNCCGILICGTGIGMSMAANRYRDIRAALCTTAEQAKMAKGHNDSNVLCLGARVTSEEEIVEIVKAWIETPFEGGRHTHRLSLFTNLGSEP